MLISQLFNELFKNNANRSEMADKRHNQNYFMEMTTVEGVYDYLMYVGKFLPPSVRLFIHHREILFSYLKSCAAKTAVVVQNKSDLFIRLFFLTQILEISC